MTVVTSVLLRCSAVKMFWAGGSTPCEPMMTGAGSGLPVETTVTTGLSISATGSADGVPDWPGKNSLTVPATVTLSPATIVGCFPVKAAMACLKRDLVGHSNRGQ